MALTIASTVKLNNGVEMPMLGFGTFKAQSGGEARRAVSCALEVGYRLIDTASAYGNEADVGAAIADSRIPRDQLFVTTKVWIEEQGLSLTPDACRRSLERLGLGYLDLYLIHWPAPGRWPEAWEAMLGLLDGGECRAIGVSNFQTYQIDQLLASSPVVPAVNQIELSPFLQRRDLQEYCRAKGIQVESYSPLTRAEKLRDPRLVGIAGHYGKTPAQLMLRWALQHGLVTLPKSVRPERIRENADLFDFEISPADMAAMDALEEGYYTSPESWRKQFE